MASNLWILAIILLFLNLLRTRYSRGLNKFNGPFLASFTNLWKVWYAFNSSQEPTYVDIHRKYGDIVRIGPNALSFADPQAIHDIYGPKGTPRKSEMYHTTSMPGEGVFINNLLSTTDERWHDRERRIINSAFSLTQIIRYEPWVDGTIALFLEKMRSRFVGKEGPDGIVNFMQWLGYFSADVISEMTFGERTGFLEAGKDVDNIIIGVRRVFAPWLYFSRMPVLDKLTFKNPLLMWFNRHGLFNIPNPLFPIVKRQFTDRKQHWEDTAGRPIDREVLNDKFLQAKMEHPEDVEFQPLQHSLTMVVAGSETTAITLSALFYFLLKNPRCYSKLQAEIAGLPYYPNNPAISYATAQSLPYLNACINESMRLHVVTRLPHDRVALPPGLMVCGQHIPAGTDIGVYGPVMHHRAEIFGDDVDTFRPERWLGDEEKVRKRKNSMFTFSSGKYNCLGKDIARMEIAKLVPSVMRAFEISLVNPERNWTLIPGAFAIPADFNVRMKEIRR